MGDPLPAEDTSDVGGSPWLTPDQIVFVNSMIDGSDGYKNGVIGNAAARIFDITDYNKGDLAYSGLKIINGATLYRFQIIRLPLETGFLMVARLDDSKSSWSHLYKFSPTFVLRNGAKSVPATAPSVRISNPEAQIFCDADFKVFVPLLNEEIALRNATAAQDLARKLAPR